MAELMRHVAAATKLVLPGHYSPLTLGGDAVGYVLPSLAERLWALGCGGAPDSVAVPDAAELARCVAALAEAGLFRPRGELFDVRATQDGPLLAQLDRAALPLLGIEAAGVHVNGLVRGAYGWNLWIARRSADKALDPGKLDHLVAGGISAGMDANATLIKEAGEEAGISPALASRARFTGIINYAMKRKEGLRRDRLYCFDLEVPADFVPTPRDGEVEAFFLMPVNAVLARVRDTDDFKFNVNLVLIDLLIRLGAIDPTSPEAISLRRAGVGGG